MEILFTHPLGTQINVTITDETQLLTTLRKYGRLGWTSGALPSGGLTFPLANADDFDFSLIGAHAYTTAEGDKAVMYRGHSYKRWELEEVETKKMGKLPRIVKYSRGARPTDLPHTKEGEEGGVQYVTLMTFWGGGRKNEAYSLPRTRVDNAAD